MRKALWLSMILLTARPAVADPSATLPLDEVLRLYRAEQQKGAPTEQRPPVRASVGKADMLGRLLDDALEVSATFEVTVLVDDGWTAVPLLQKDTGTSIASLPTVEGATLAVVDGRLSLLTNKVGTYSFEVSFRKRASAGSLSRRRVELSLPTAAEETLRVRYDDALFHLFGDDNADDGEGVAIYPDGARFVVEWARTAVPKQAKKPRPPVESIITAAHGSVVSTLTGRTVTRVAYDLQLGGIRPLDFTLPEGETLERVYVNGAAVPATAHGQHLRLEVSPARPGDDTARVELVLNAQQGAYFLSGKLSYLLPAASWNCNELYLTLHMPEAFNYQWIGGTLAPVESVEAESYAYDIPTPGKTVLLHQQLVDQVPSSQIAYSVDLANSYFH